MRVLRSKSGYERPARETGQAVSILSTTSIKADMEFSQGGSSAAAQPSTWKPVDQGKDVSEREGVHAPETQNPDRDAFVLKRKKEHVTKPVNVAKPLKAFPTREDYKKDNGVHREFLDKGLRKGGVPSGYPRRFPSGMSGLTSDDAQKVAEGVAPGDVYGSLENILVYEYSYTNVPLYQDDVTDVGPVENNYTQHEQDSNFSNKTRPRPNRKNDRDITQDSKLPTGEAYPIDYDVYTGLGNVMYPISGAWFKTETRTQPFYMAEGRGKNKKTFNGTIVYNGEAQKGQVWVRIKRSLAKNAVFVPTFAEFYIEYDETSKKFVYSKPGQNLDQIPDWAVQKLIDFTLDKTPPIYKIPPPPKTPKTPAQPKVSKAKARSSPLPGDKGYNILTDPLIDQAAPGITETEKLFTRLTKWNPPSRDLSGSGFTGTINIPTDRIKEATFDVLMKNPKGDGQYFNWNYVSESQVSKMKQVEVKETGVHTGGESSVSVAKKAAWDEAQKKLEDLREAQRQQEQQALSQTQPTTPAPATPAATPTTAPTPAPATQPPATTP